MDQRQLLQQARLNIDDLYLFDTGQARQAYLTFGCHFLPELGLHRFVLWAPNAEAASVVGDFNHWDAAAHPMTRLDNGVFVALIPGLRDGDLYKYHLRQYGGGQVLKSDPFAFHAESEEHTASKVWSIDGYSWNDGDFLAQRAASDPHQQPLSIYELHLGSWRVPEGAVYPWYRQIAAELADYCRQMGYTHVELLPVTEYPLAESWGYQVTGYYAPTSRYGTPQDFMFLVDTLHQNGIGVIVDWVPAHFPKDQHGLARFDGTALFEHQDPRRGEHAQWGTLVFNYGRPQVRSFLISAAYLFFDRYHIDGLRVDAVSSMLYLSYGRQPGQHALNAQGGDIDLEAVDFLRQLNSALLTDFPGCLTAAEESTAYPLVTRPPDHGGLGFSFKWDMGFMHDTLAYMSMDHFFRQHNHNRLTFSMAYAFSESFILAYSHDEVVHGKKSMLDKMFGDYWQKFAALRALFGYQYAHPGKKLNFMGAEFGQFIEWDHRKQLDWLLLDYPSHRGMQDYVRRLNFFYRQHPALFRVEDSWDGFTWLNVDDNSNSAVAFLRRADSDDAGQIVCACNFTPNVQMSFIIGLPEPGTLRELLNSDDPEFGGSGVRNLPLLRSRRQPFGSFPVSAKLILPPLSTVYFEYLPTPEPTESGRETGQIEGQ